MSTTTIPEQFTGYAAFEKQHDVFDLKPHSYTPRAFAESDIDVKIIASGVCGSDVHTLRSGWGASSYPAIVGHESGHQVGKIVGFGAQCDSCGRCHACNGDAENYCSKWMPTYQGPLANGEYTQGGYGKFAIEVPEQLEAKYAAPMLCAGVTVYSPLKAYGAGPDKRVGVIGIGGLGHLGLQFSKALGAETYAFSRSDAKKDEALKLGADDLVATSDQSAVLEKYAGTFDLLICTNFQDNLPIESFYFKLLKPRGHFVLLGLPESLLPAMSPAAILGRSLTGSLIGSPAEIKDMFALAVEHGVKPVIETRKMSEVSQTVTDMHAGKARFRYVLLNE
ncbi:hypothetical protein IAU60_001205 [Kwoniella sp. DSM 27419]